MPGQGSIPFNAEVFAQLRRQIDSVSTGGQLQQITTQAMGSLNGVTAGITSQIAALQPILALLQPPAANPAEIVTWINKLISGFVEPYTKPAMTLPIQIAQLTTEVGLLTASIQAAAARLGEAVEIPSVEIPVFPDPPQPPTGP